MICRVDTVTIILFVINSKYHFFCSMFFRAAVPISISSLPFVVFIFLVIIGNFPIIVRFIR